MLMCLAHQQSGPEATGLIFAENSAFQTERTERVLKMINHHFKNITTKGGIVVWQGRSVWAPSSLGTPGRAFMLAIFFGSYSVSA